jgi:acetate kinase
MIASVIRPILTINTGSSSLKAGIYRGDEAAGSIEIDRIGQPACRLRLTDAHGARIEEETLDALDHRGALQEALNRFPPPWLAIAHRVVHGGDRFVAPTVIDDAVFEALSELVPLAPNHLPQALHAIDAITVQHPECTQIACFDTAFHATMPRLATLYALPEHPGLRRYGFHGLSYESVIATLREDAPELAEKRLIVAHLGNGASMAAIEGGKSAETTMGFTPSGGLVMATRPGDLDPGVLLYLLRNDQLRPDELGELIHHRAGLTALAGSGDMRDLLEREADDPRAAEAVALFCYQAKKFIGALTATLGGIDGLIFTGGVGEHAAPIRERICAGLAYLGVALDPERNHGHEAVISTDPAPVAVRIVHSDEDRMLAHHALTLLHEGDAVHV